MNSSITSRIRAESPATTWQVRLTDGTTITGTVTQDGPTVTVVAGTTTWTVDPDHVIAIANAA
jgi:hypothetical protein